MRIALLVLLVIGACDSPHEPDVVGPYTGEARRFVVDRIYVPVTHTQAREYGGYIDDNDVIDNGLGSALALLASQDDVTGHGDDMINAGVIASSLIVTADDFTNDESVSVRYLASDDDTTGIEVGGRLIDGVFEPNRTRWTQVPGAATVHLPVFVDADPSVVRLEGLEIELEPDGTGGFVAGIHGVVENALDAAYPGIAQMIESRPYDHVMLKHDLDGNRDGVVSREELAADGLFVSVLSPDVTYRGKKVSSFGFEAVLRPCAEGRCNTPHPSCFNRAIDGDEADLDCGGGCRGCIEGATCTVPADCESLDCTAGLCGPPSCRNGVRDGYETDQDCGYVCGVGCAVGKGCLEDSDCAGGQCGEPCDGPLCFGDGYRYSSCR